MNFNYYLSHLEAQSIFYFYVVSKKRKALSFYSNNSKNDKCGVGDLDLIHEVHGEFFF